MYLIVDKKTQAVLHMSNSYPGEDKKPEDIFPTFDAATMDFGRAPEQFIPVHFAIIDGVVKDLQPAQAAPAETLSQARDRMLLVFSDLSLALRRQVLPDHQLLNAGIGLYDEERTQSLRDTVQAFRDEFHRLQGEVAKAKSVKDLDAIKPAFPAALVVLKVKAARKTK